MQLGRELESQGDWNLTPESLVTHGVILGMTGSGKTGLAMTLLEELVQAEVPLLLIDPKGDLVNLGLLFPEARADQLLPWIDAAQAQRQGLTSEALAQEWSQQIQRGRLEWGIGASRVAALRDRLQLNIYTPGSRAGKPVNLLGSFQCPPAEVLQDTEARAELVSGTIQSLLSLVGVQADPIRSPEAVVLSQILDQAWDQGQDLTLENLVLRLVDPPFKKVGVFPLESFFPSAQRLEIAMKLNAMLASTSFAPWCEGQALQPASLTQASTGKVPVSLFYLAHLNDSERMFFVSTLLHRVRSWSRGLSGTSSLRCLVYFDEVAGYMPPHPANPPSKQPLLSLMKQSRAVGLGVVLATQNPVDIDYKGLANAGTWWIGRMQTSQDRQRVAEGLMVAEAGMDSTQLQRQFEQLESRVFLVKSPAQSLPQKIRTRHAMALLRGPVTKAELSRIQPPEAPSSAAPQAPAPPTAEASSGFSQPPALPAGFQQAFLDPRVVFSAQLQGALENWAEPARKDGKSFWKPALWGELQLRFDEDKGGFVLDESHHYVFFPLGDQLPTEWLRLPLEGQDLLSGGEGIFEALPDSFDESSEFKAAQQNMVEDVFRRVTSSQWVHADLKLYGGGGESEADFRARVEAAIQERVDSQVARLQTKLEKDISSLQDRLARHESKLENLRNEAGRRQTESIWNAGTAVLSFFTGRKKSLGSVLGSANRTSTAKDRVNHAQTELEQMQQQMEALQAQLEEQVEKIRSTEMAAMDRIEARAVRLERSDIRLQRFGILWIPVTRRA